MNLFKKMFGKKGSSEVIDLIESTLEGIFDASGLELSFEVQAEGEEVYDVELFGEDEEFLKDKDGQLLDAMQFFTKRVIQHQFPESRVKLFFDSNGFRDEANQALMDLADRLRSMALEKKKSVYCKALPPKDRRIIHQHLADDGRVKTRSIGEGHYKKIKIFPANSGGGSRRHRRGNNNRRREAEVNGNR